MATNSRKMKGEGYQHSLIQVLVLHILHFPDSELNGWNQKRLPYQNRMEMNISSRGDDPKGIEGNRDDCIHHRDTLLTKRC